MKWHICRNKIIHMYFSFMCFLLCMEGGNNQRVLWLLSTEYWYFSTRKLLLLIFWKREKNVSLLFYLVMHSVFDYWSGMNQQPWSIGWLSNQLSYQARASTRKKLRNKMKRPNILSTCLVLAVLHYNHHQLLNTVLICDTYNLK